METTRTFTPKRIVVRPGLLAMAVLFVSALAAEFAPSWAQNLIWGTCIACVPAVFLAGHWLFSGARVELGDDELHLVGWRRISIPRARLTVTREPLWFELPVLVGMLRPWIERRKGRPLNFGFPVQLSVCGFEIYVIFEDAADADRLLDGLSAQKARRSVIRRLLMTMRWI